MAKPGPKPKAAGERLSKPVTVLFTPGEVKDIRRAAGGESVSSWIRSRILQLLGGETKAESVLERTERIHAQMEASERQVEEQLREIREIQEAARKMLGEVDRRAKRPGGKDRGR